MRIILLIAVLLIFTSKVDAQTRFKVGDAVPDIQITDWVSGQPADPSLKNKTIVIDFWATWCGPCLKAVPHFNELVNEFGEDEYMRFLSMSDESPSRIRRTLERVNFQSYVVTDTEKSTQNSFGITAIPYTLVINSDGKLVWQGQPEDLTSEMLKEYNETGSITSSKATSDASKDKKKYISDVEKNEGLKKLMSMYKDTAFTSIFDIIPTDQEPGITVNSLPAIYYKAGADIGSLIASTYSFPRYRVIMPADLEDVRFNIAYLDKEATDKEEAQKYIVDQVLDEYDLKTTEETRRLIGYSISQTDTSKLTPSDSKQGSLSSAGDKMIYTAVTLEDMILNLEGQIEKPIKLATPIEGAFDFIISVSDTDSFRESMKSYGFELEEKEMSVDFIKITTATQ